MIVAGAWFAPELRNLFETMLKDFGITGLANWHYYALAATLAVITLAWQVARLITPKVRFTDLRATEFEDRQYCKLTIKNDTSEHLTLLAEMRVKKQDGSYFAVNGRDRFVLLTQKRLVERRIHPNRVSERKRFNLGSFESKDIEFAIISNALWGISVYDELGEVDIPTDHYILEISVSGGGTPSISEIEIWDYETPEDYNIALSVNRPSLRNVKPLCFRRRVTRPPNEASIPQLPPDIAEKTPH